MYTLPETDTTCKCKKNKPKMVRQCDPVIETEANTDVQKREGYLHSFNLK